MSFKTWIAAQIYRGESKAPSGKWEQWYTTLTATTCLICRSMHGRILDDTWPQTLAVIPPVHDRCRCDIILLPAIQLGTATISGNQGADIWISLYNTLPSQYIKKKEAKANGWISVLGNLWDVLPSAVIGGDVFGNREGKLPTGPGRIWYEADINYVGGLRGAARILCSNNGLIFVTYDHYMTFLEVY